jgi:hypothetical protein
MPGFDMSDAPQPATILMVGDRSDAGWHGPVERARVVPCVDLDDAIQECGALPGGPHLVVLCESRPGQFPPAALDRFRLRFPLVRLVRVLGTWCEGGAREALVTHGCWPAYEHQWHARFARELERRDRGQNPHWALPATTSREEQLAVCSQDWPSGSRGRSIAVCAASAESSAALVAVCRRAGYSALETPAAATFRLAGVAAVVWDAAVREIANPATVAALLDRACGAPVVAVTGFPRPDDIDQASAAGLAAVLAKPFLASDLLWHIERQCLRAS